MAPRMLVGSIGTVILFVLIYLKKEKLILPPITLTIAISTFYIWHLISVSWSLNAADAIAESQKILFGISVLIIGLNLTAVRKTMEGFYLLITLVSIPFSLLCIYDLYTSQAEGLLVWSISLAGHENLAASAAYLFLIPISIGIQYVQPKWLSWIALALLAIVIAFAGSRAVYVAVGFAVLIGGTYWLMRNWPSKRRMSYVGVGFALTISIGFLAERTNFLDNLGVFSEKEMASVNERYKLWENSNQLIADYPVAGVGAANWRFNYAAYGLDGLDRATDYGIVFTRPHNDFITVWSELGGIGFVIAVVIGFFLLTLILLIPPEFSKTTLPILAGLSGFIIIAFLSFPKERPLHIVLFALILLIISRESKISKAVGSWKQKLFVGFLILGNLLTIWVFADRARGEYHTKNLLSHMEHSDDVRTLEDALRAPSLFYSADPTGTPIYSYIGWCYNNRTDLDNLLKYSKLAYELSPKDYKTTSNYGYALQRHHKFREAEELYMESYEINPKYESNLINLFALEYNRGNYQESYDWLIKVKNYADKYPTNIERLKEHIEIP